MAEAAGGPRPDGEGRGAAVRGGRAGRRRHSRSSSSRPLQTAQGPAAPRRAGPPPARDAPTRGSARPAARPRTRVREALRRRALRGRGAGRAEGGGAYGEGRGQARGDGGRVARSGGGGAAGAAARREAHDPGALREGRRGEEHLQRPPGSRAGGGRGQAGGLRGPGRAGRALRFEARRRRVSEPRAGGAGRGQHLRAVPPGACPAAHRE